MTTPEPMTEPRRVRTQAERAGDDHTWRVSDAELIPWLRRQLDADEQAARAVEGLRKPYYFDFIDDAARPFVELSLDPARWLAEVDAKRAIIADCEERRSIQAFEALKLLALPYQERPGYQADWPHSQAGWPVMSPVSAWEILGAWAPPPRRRWWHRLTRRNP